MRFKNTPITFHKFKRNFMTSKEKSTIAPCHNSECVCLHRFHWVADFHWGQAGWHISLQVDWLDSGGYEEQANNHFTWWVTIFRIIKLPFVAALSVMCPLCFQGLFLNLSWDHSALQAPGLPSEPRFPTWEAWSTLNFHYIRLPSKGFNSSIFISFLFFSAFLYLKAENSGLWKQKSLLSRL